MIRLNPKPIFFNRLWKSQVYDRDCRGDFDLHVDVYMQC